MNHLRGNLKGRFTRYENDTPPIALLHFRKIRATQADAGHDINCEEFLPICIRNLLERLWLKNPCVIDENVDAWELANHFVASFCTSEIGRDPTQIRGAEPLRNPGNRFTDMLVGAAIDNDFGTFRREAGCDREADASGRSRD